MPDLPTQRALQLVGPDQLRLNEAKPIPEPGPWQLLARVEVTGLCFSDLKLLKQFDRHPRKSPVLTGLDHEALVDMPHYVPGDRPTVPGHETVVRILRVGDKVTLVQPGDRCLVQTDYRHLRTDQSAAAFGYNFEGALQEVVLMDERVVRAPDGVSMLLSAEESLPASAVALVEPWACVEDSYVVRERTGPREGGARLILDAASATPATLASVPDGSIDDLVVLGADPDLLETAFPKMAKGGLVNLVLRGARFGRPVRTPVGQLHYGGLRITGTTGQDPEEGYRRIPASVDLREGDRINVVGAGGPMGAMHMVRNLCQGVPGIEVWGGDRSEERLAQLRRIAEPLARDRGLSFTAYHADRDPPEGDFRYIALMVPVPALVEEAIHHAAPGAVINIFAGIPADVSHPLDLDAYVERGAYFIGTSGSTIEDMKIVLGKVTDRTLDTNLSVAAVAGLDGAIDGIRAVERQAIAGKILVYPSCRGLPLTPLADLADRLPQVAAALRDGCWTAEAEQALLAAFRMEGAS